MRMIILSIRIPRVFGGIQGLRHHPVVINKIARVTFIPKSGNKDKIRGLYWNVISHVMNGNRINIIALMMDQLAYLRLNLEMNLYFAPYIMSIMKAKTSFRGICECKHTPLRPFKNDTAFLLRPLTPFPGDDMDEEEHGHDDDNGDGDDDAHMGAAATQHAMPPPQPPVQPQFAPPAGYFDPYFASIQQGMTSHMDGLVTQMQTQMYLGFQNMQQQMTQHFHESMFQPMMAQMQGVQESLHSDIAVFDSRFEDMPSSEQFGQLEDRQQ